MDDNDMAICRIDYMKFSDMEKIRDLVNSVRCHACVTNESKNEDHIRKVVEQIEEVVDYNLSDDNAYRIVLMLRGLISYVRTHVFDENEAHVIWTTGQIIKLVQGDKKMNENQIAAMTFRRVKEAIERVVLSTDPNFGDERITTVAEDYANRIVSDVFGGKSKFELRSSQFVDQYYEMDPETEDLLGNGSYVIDDMKVLIEAPELRVHIHENMTPIEISNARVKNRWATVEDRKLINGNLSFVAVYDDGVKRKVVQDIGLAWLVKKDSIPRIDLLMNLEGMLHEEAPTAKMVAFLKDRMKMAMHFDVKGLKIQTGIDGDVIPLSEYLIREGVVPASDSDNDNATHVVYNEKATPIFTGSVSAILEWATELNDIIGGERYAGFAVASLNAADVTLAEFVEEHSG